MNDIVQSLRKSFNSNVTKSIDWRIKQLKGLERLLIENESAICSALEKDLNKHAQETVVTEIGMIKNAITHSLNHIHEYSKPKAVTPQLQMRMSYSAYVQYQPYGVVLVIGAWNYPFQLCFVPLVGALSSGNCVLIKPSELSEASSKLMEELIPKYLDPVSLKITN
jgi:acyl-CoA reductase-like NAD-dependent aldehyde dehydrogenase